MIRRAIVLAAGKGTRMKSERPKVLHRLCGREMLWYALRALRGAEVDEVVVVANVAVAEHVETLARDVGLPRVRTVIQVEQLGTGHAVQVGLSAFEPRDARVVVLGADMPLVDEEIVGRLIAVDDAALAMITARMPTTSNFGRVVREGDRVLRIVELRDASDAERAIDEMNAGLYAFDERKLREAIAELTTDNAQGEYYLTDTVARFAGAGERIVPLLIDDHRRVLGVNDRAELALARAHLNALLCERHMREGVTIVDPATTYLESGLQIASDVVILPNTTIGRGTSIGAHSEIGPNVRLHDARIGRHVVVSESVIVDSEIGDFVVVGPFAHIRGGSSVGTGARIGNFVETKNSALAPGVKAGHLTYLGDATVGERTNIGAGTITCNYDGERKHRTEIGADAFIGSNSSLVAPVRIGDRALTGAGAVVTRDVPGGERVVGNPARPLPKVGESDSER